jgi:hypothetical protein
VLGQVATERGAPYLGNASGAALGRRRRRRVRVTTRPQHSSLIIDQYSVLSFSHAQIQRRIDIGMLNQCMCIFHQSPASSIMTTCACQ